MRTQFETLLIESRADKVLVVTINRPAAANAINTALGRELLELFSELIADPALARVVVLTGSGDRAFCAGGDLKERHGMTDEQWNAQHLVFERMIRAVIECPVPVIAAVNGAAFGGGCELALGCDFIYASRTARFALTEVTLGIMPGTGGTQNLPRAIGSRRAKELIFSGRPFGAEDAHAWGLVNKLCEPASLMTETLTAAQTIAANAPIAIRQAKRAIDLGTQMSIAEGMAFEIEAYNRMVTTQDRREGVRAFNEKRKPRFEGR
ncbi:MAG: enoyl-CoA hydratase/isomerase family protein [Xanthobacteraceae bacterium]